VPGFDKSQNSLFEIHAHTTTRGLVFVNLNAGEPESFDEMIVSSLDAFSYTSGLEANSSWVNGQTLTGEFNWKVGSEWHIKDFKGNPLNC
jgi:phenylpropionate dioxygenase-like ring-hydroxylating dioxygenase large terminal subunit